MKYGLIFPRFHALAHPFLCEKVVSIGKKKNWRRSVFYPESPKRGMLRQYYGLRKTTRFGDCQDSFGLILQARRIVLEVGVLPQGPHKFWQTTRQSTEALGESKRC